MDQEEVERQLRGILDHYGHTVNDNAVSSFVSRMLQSIKSAQDGEKEGSNFDDLLKAQTKRQGNELKEFEKFKDFFESCKEDFIQRELLFAVDSEETIEDVPFDPDDHEKWEPIEENGEILFYASKTPTDRTKEKKIVDDLSVSLDTLIAVLKSGITQNRGVRGRPPRHFRNDVFRDVFIAMECLLDVSVQRTNQRCLSTEIFLFAAALFENRISPTGEIRWKAAAINIHEALHLYYEDEQNVFLMRKSYQTYDRPDLFLRHLERTPFSGSAVAE